MTRIYFHNTANNPVSLRGMTYAVGPLHRKAAAPYGLASLQTRPVYVAQVPIYIARIPVYVPRISVYITQ